MNWEAFITCAVTGAGETVDKHPAIPVTPEEIAGSAIEAAKVGVAVTLPWSKLQAPELTDALIERIVEQSDAQAGGRSVRELERQRDACLVAILGALAEQNYGAGTLPDKDSDL